MSGAYRGVLALALVAALAGAVLLAPASAAAQEQTPTAGGNVSVDVDLEDGKENAQDLSATLEVKSAAYDDSSGFAVVVIKSDRPERLTIADAGAFFEGGRVNTRRITLDAGEEKRVRLRVTEADGFVGLSIATANGQLYGLPIDDDRDFFDRDPDWRDAQLAGGAGALGSLALVAGIAYRRKFSGREEVEREL